MTQKDFITVFSGHPKIKEIVRQLNDYINIKISTENLKGSSKALLTALVSSSLNKDICCVLDDREQALYFANDLESFSSGNKVYLFTSSFKNDDPEIPFNPFVQKRTEISNIIAKKSSSSRIIVTYPEALCEFVVHAEDIFSNTLTIKTGKELDINFLIEFLNEYGFEATEYVYEAGSYAIRGGITDIFSFGNPYPYRIEFKGDIVESIREFDPETQLSTRKMDFISIIPNLEFSQQLQIRKIPFTRLLSPDSVFILNNPDLISARIDAFRKKIRNAAKTREHEETPELADAKLFFADIEQFSVVTFSKTAKLISDIEFVFNTSPQPAFNRNFSMLGEKLCENLKNGYKNFIFSDSPKQIERIYAIFEDINPEVSFQAVYQSLHSGFTDHDLKISAYTEHEIFARYHKYREEKVFTKNKALGLKELHELKPGDYITHINYGIGRFSGLEKIITGGRKQEALRIEYKDGDLLYVSIHSMYKISRYTGKEGTQPVLHRLGSKTWENLKSKTKNRVKDIARDLIKLYAQRRAKQGFAFSPDSYLQTELEASFIYEDTPDQYKATEDVKQDMERSYPMDRLICGDVGYGKTEVAIRAAFKAVADSKQVAVLVPTTILAFQHYKTFSERLKDFPCTVEYLSRFKTSRQQAIIRQKLSGGKIDIIIGTHKLLGKDIKFKDLGLLIIDEEQKFGVSAKEKLRELKINVDTLTLTATPIPRTLQFSLMGVRDLSVITTPPPNRQPIDTFIKTFDEDVIREAIEKELERGGQVFFVHNRIHDLEKTANVVRNLVPYAKIGIAHGRMEGYDLEETMINFINGYYDILVSTNIIESGLDIPNANTIIIDDAHTFGLSDLYQMRGRVGRSNIKAYCYLIVPDLGNLSLDARRRLAAIEEFSELGSGLHVAMRDLDIRGAGNLLGAEQSGFINEIGIETYKKILDEAIAELKMEEFKDIFDEREQVKLFQECVIETDFEVLIPDEYISNIEERLALYNRLNVIQDEKKLKDFAAELIDRFGPLPWQVNDLLDLIRLKWQATKLGVEKIVLKNSTLKISFPYIYAKSEKFTQQIFLKVLNFVKKHPNTCQFQEKSNGLDLIIKPVVFIDEALNLISEIHQSA